VCFAVCVVVCCVMCCSVLECVVVCIAVCIAVCCSVLQCVAVWIFNRSKKSQKSTCYSIYNVYYSVCCNVCGSVLQCVAVRCSALQCVAVCCSVMQCAFPFIWKVSNVNSLLDSQCKSNVYRSLLTKSTAMCCDTIHHTATHCNTLQHTATHRNTLESNETYHRQLTVKMSATHKGQASHFNKNCTMLHHCAPHFAKMQHHITLQHTRQHTASLCNTLQHTLQHTAPL